MQITVKLYASLSDFLPPATRGNKFDLEIDDGTTIGSVIASLNLPPKLVHLVLLNGRYIAPAERSQVSMRAGDALALWPPVAGG